MQIDKTKVKELFIAGSLNPAIAMLFRAKAVPGLLIVVCEMAIRISALHDKAKKNLDKIRQCINGKIWVRYGSKTRTKHYENWTKKINYC